MKNINVNRKEFMAIIIKYFCFTHCWLFQVLVSEAGRVPAQLRLQERQAGGSGELHNNNSNDLFNIYII